MLFLFFGFVFFGGGVELEVFLTSAASRRGSGAPETERSHGANPLYLLSEHAGIEAEIMPPENWKDPAADAPDVL
jgi:hypothetical protein